jgi:hypothetical protein
VVRYERIQQYVEEVYLRYRKPQLFLKAFEVLLGTLLAMETDPVMKALQRKSGSGFPA